MAVAPENAIMALYCDFENVALGVRDAKYDKFDIKPVLERLLLKGSIVVKKAYCDWERYKGFKSTMHEASFELIEIPHLRQSGKNSADIRLVVDALDLCYTKSHVDTFVIISGDSDFSPLVSKLRENAKYVIGVGVKQSTSDLLIGNCDEFIFYDDLVRESQRTARRDSKELPPAVRRSPEEDAQRRAEVEARRSKAIELAVATFDALVAERGDSSKIWASMLKEAIKRRKPDFSESYYGFRAFGNLLEEAQARGLLEIGRDEKSGTYVYRTNGVPAPLPPAVEPLLETVTETLVEPVDEGVGGEPATEASDVRRKAQGRRKAGEKGVRRSRAKEVKEDAVDAEVVERAADLVMAPAVHDLPTDGQVPGASEAAGEIPAAEVSLTTAGVESLPAVGEAEPAAEQMTPLVSGDETPAKMVQKPASRSRRPRKPKEAPEEAV
ncbi:NYN domain-containing protein [Accumulibacter sp.]|uniref:NYN domain-containing protein n=1 Tax=Accumulibacter sp. TaxID=2053492 RepID=UPI002617944F|nr:NYN domain-containing protein [Accumulibacter sp.]